MKFAIWFIPFIVLNCTYVLPANAGSGFQLTMQVDVRNSFFIDIELPKNTGSNKSSYEFWLHQKLIPESTHNGTIITPCAKKSARIPKQVNCWNLITFGKGSHSFKVKLSKMAQLPVSFGESLIDLSKGIILYGSDFWYPYFQGKLLNPNIEVLVQDGWSWVASPTGFATEGLYVFAGPYTTFSHHENGISYHVMLLQNEKKLADQYLSSLQNIVLQYQSSIGAYPYPSFYVVENPFSETGYGLPGATLLGSQVLRLPFIFSSSLPHEVLHNWWGNGVFIDDQFGNWAEGLTTYQSDYLYAEKQGRGSLYRLNQLLQYQDYHLNQKELPLTEFRFRHNDSSQALGYGKSMMLFHMVRRRIGDRAFDLALKNFFHDNVFKFANFMELANYFQKASSDQNFTSWFKDWISKRGQPQLKISNPFQESLSDSTYMVQFELDQVPSPNLMSFDIPIEFTFQSGNKRTEVVRIDNKKHQTINFIFSERVSQFRIDPEFHVFRKVGPKERPPQLLAAFTSDEIFLYNQSLQGADQALVDTLTERFSTLSKWDIIFQISDPSLLSKSLFLIGFDQDIEAFLSPMINQLNQNLRLKGRDIEFLDANLNWQKLERNSQDLIAVFKNPSDPKVPIVWILPSHQHTQGLSSLKGLFKRLTHYATSTLLVLDQRRTIVNKTIVPEMGELTHRF